jgi:hypothetical protein
MHRLASIVPISLSWFTLLSRCPLWELATSTHDFDQYCEVMDHGKYYPDH